MSTFIINRSRNAKENPNKVTLKGKVKKTSLSCGAFLYSWNTRLYSVLLKFL